MYSVVHCIAANTHLMITQNQQKNYGRYYRSYKWNIPPIYYKGFISDFLYVNSVEIKLFILSQLSDVKLTGFSFM